MRERDETSPYPEWVDDCHRVAVDSRPIDQALAGLRRRRLGTFAPDRRASERPIAMACLRLVTLRPDRPLRSVPRFRSRIARATLRCACLPYFAITLTSCDDVA